MNYYKKWNDSALSFRSFLLQLDITTTEFWLTYDALVSGSVETAFNKAIQLIVNKKQFKNTFNDLIS